MTAYLKWEDRHLLSDAERSSMEAAVTEGVTEEPQQPEALTLWRRLQAYNTLYWGNSYSEQPYILLRELNTARDAELEYRQLQALNLARRQKAQGSKA